MTMGERIKMLREQRGITQSELAEICKVSDKAISTWENGRNIPRMGAIQRMADYFGIPKSAIIENIAPPVNAIRIPVLGNIPAGIPLSAVEDIEGWEELSPDMLRGGKEYFALAIKGDSMMPEYRDGDVLILRKQDSCETGDDCAVMVNGDDATFKRVRRSKKGITLQPLNPTYDPMFFSNEEIMSLPVRIIGVVVEIRRKIRR